MSGAMWKQVLSLGSARGGFWDATKLHRCDPYLVWADAVTTPGEGNKLVIAVLVELNDRLDFWPLLERLNANVPSFLPSGFEDWEKTCFVAGFVSNKGLNALVNEVVGGKIERFSLQDSREDAGRTVKAAWRLLGLPWFRPPAPASGSAAPGAADASGAGTFLGIVDDGLPALRVREAIQRTGRAASFWDQGWQPPEQWQNKVGPGAPSQDDEYWNPPWEEGKEWRGFLYGRRLKPVLAAAGAHRPSDRDEYAQIRYFTPAPRQSHGAAVLGLLAPWLSGARGAVQWPAHISGLAMVQLPTRTVADTSGGSLAVRVLDGLRFILWREHRDRPDPQRARPIVANVSYGVHAGPHDGSSMFERAVLELLGANKHLHLILPAGNAARAGCHARRTLARNGAAKDTASFRLQVLPDNGRDTFVELWLSKGAKVHVAIRPPGSGQVHHIDEGEAWVYFEPKPGQPDTPKTVHFGAVYSSSVAQSNERTMVLLAIGATRRMGRATSFGRDLNQQKRVELAGYPGLWELTVRNLRSSEATVDAYVERGDASPDASAGSRQAFFPDSCVDAVRLDNATPEDTLNGIATMKHPQLHVVGAMRVDGVLSGYSAAGHDGPSGPDVVAPADASKTLPGLRTMGFVRGAASRINGTSAACAVFGRALAKQLADDPTVPPSAPAPGAVPPEISCVTDSQPEAPAALRGQAVRMLFPYDVDL